MWMWSVDSTSKAANMLRTQFQLVLLLSIVLTTWAASMKTQPSNTSVVAGETGQLDCVFDIPVSSCYWNKDEVPIEISDRYQFLNGATAATTGDCSLRITTAQLKLDDGVWNCGTAQTSDHAGVQSQKAQFTVLLTPKEPVILLNGLQQDNESSVPLDLSNLPKITCVSENGNPPANLSWQLVSTPIAGSTTLYDTTDDKIKRVELNITQGIDDSWKEQNLNCISKHQSYAPNEQHYTYVTLKIPYATTTVTTSSANGTTDTTIKVDNQVWIGLNCTADGFPEPSYRWDRRTDENSPWQLYKNEQNISFQAFSAQFQCVASNTLTPEEIRSREIYTLITSSASSAKIGIIISIVVVVLVLIVFMITGILYLYKAKKWPFKAPVQHREQNIREAGPLNHDIIRETAVPLGKPHEDAEQNEELLKPKQDTQTAPTSNELVYAQLSFNGNNPQRSPNNNNNGTEYATLTFDKSAKSPPSDSEQS